jgi:hypothetical protein
VTIEAHRVRSGLAPLGLLGLWPAWRELSLAHEAHPSRGVAPAEALAEQAFGG